MKTYSVWSIAGISGYAAGFVVVFFFGTAQAQATTTIYQTNFNSLTLGHTQPDPGAAGQDGWYALSAQGAAFGEIEGSIANVGRALHEFAPNTNPPGLQTIDQRRLGPFNVAGATNITLSAHFYAHSSDLSRVNSYEAELRVGGGPHPGFEIIRFGLGGGNGTAKNVTGLEVGLSRFNGLDNNIGVPLAIGQDLSWDAWHELSLSVDQVHDHYLSITIDGQTQNLTAYALPRGFDGIQWKRGQLIEFLNAVVLPSGQGGVSTNDDIYWDNVSITMVPEPSAFVLATVAGLLALGSRRGRWV